MASREPTPKPPQTSLAKWAPLLVGLFIVGYFAALGFYFYGIGPERYSTVEATRPILVFTLIVAMLAFGGVLIFRSLFGPDDGFKERFTRAREIFLIFSGIFGTIIGFYFGAADGDAGAPPSLGAPAYAGGQVTARIDGGRAPFIAFLTRDGRPDGQVIEGDDRNLAFAVAGGCPADATVTVVDGEGRRDEAEVACSEEAAGGPANQIENAAR